MKLVLIALAGILTWTGNWNTKNTSNMESMNKTSFYDFTAKTINGESFDFKSLKGKKVMIVNTASECGFTPQYQQLQELYDTYGGKDFEIIGFPANNFGKQEPGKNAEIAAFCKKNYGVTFTMMSKIDVIGENQNPIYKWLTQKAENGVKDSEVKWNFQKYLINQNGTLVEVLSSNVSPLDEVVLDFIAS